MQILLKFKIINLSFIAYYLDIKIFQKYNTMEVT